MKTMKKITAVFLSVCMTIGLGVTAGAAAPREMQAVPVEEPVQETQVEMTQEEYEATLPAETLLAMEQQEKPLEAYQNLIATFPKDANGETICPNGYGGSMVEGDQLVISLVNPTEEMKEDYLERCKLDTCVTFRKVENSLNDLEAVRTQADQLQNQGFDVVSTSIDVKNNELVVGLNQEEHTLSKAVPRADQDFFGIDLFSALIGDQRKAQLALNDLPVRVTMETPAISAVNVRGGNGLSLSSSGSYSFSCGFAGRYEGKNAIITCGHGNENWPSVYLSGTKIGEVVKYRGNPSNMSIGVNALGDFAIVETNSNASLSNRLGNGALVVSAGSVPVGTTVSKYGASTATSSGTVQQIGTNVKYNMGQTEYFGKNLWTIGMTKSGSNKLCAKGDSGGPVYRKYGSGVQANAVVTAFRTNSSGIATLMYVSPISLAQEVGFAVKTS